MNRPVFSIITATLNQGARLRGAIESVLAQEGCGSIQHIVVDGGSTDETDEILKEYPHLTIVRSPFTSISQALNVGFSVASGEIVSWLHPNDRYARGGFAEVIGEIERHPVVMGACGVIGDHGAVVSRVENVERSWFDTIKYWVAHALPTQPALFFKRSILSELRIEPSEVFDEGLHAAMDFDLWLRLQEAYPFSLRTPHIVAYRHQRDLVTGGVDASVLQAEMSRVFRRHSTRRVQPEQNISFVVPVANGVDDVKPLLQQLTAQTLPSVEIVLVDASASRDTNRVVANAVWAHGAKHKNIALQYVPLPSDGGLSIAAALDAGVRAARSHVVACLSPSRAIPENFAADLFKLFSRDEIGLVLPSLDEELTAKLFVTKHGTRIFNPAGPFSLASEAHIECVVRKLAWIDSGGFSLHDRFPELEFSMKRLMIMLAHKAWRIVAEPLLEPLSPNGSKHDAPFRLYENSVVVDELARELRRNPFSVMRAKHGFGLVLPDDLWQCAQLVMQRIPKESPSVQPNLASATLRAITEQNPVYGPALFCLAEALDREGNIEDAKRVRSQWREVHEGEKNSPLFGGVSH
jgi:glycosyltransferase involved in cell wall biosynthesis